MNPHVNLSSSEEITYDDDDDDNTYYIINKYLINSKDIQSIKLNPLTKQSKSFKYDKIDLRNLNNSQLQDILNVKLKHTVINDNREYVVPNYKHRYEQFHRQNCFDFGYQKLKNAYCCSFHVSQSPPCPIIVELVYS